MKFIRQRIAWVDILDASSNNRVAVFISSNNERSPGAGINSA